MQATVITIQYNNADLNVVAVYCPPHYNLKKDQYIAEFINLGPRFIIGDFNTKHTAWGSRLNTPKGRELLQAINDCACNFIFSGKPTYWPSDRDRLPDLIDFFITKGISTAYIAADNVEDLSYDHIPVMMNAQR